MIGIYKITNKLNGKVYIGQSIHIKTRWIQHITAKDNILIHKSIQKYGAENFSFEVLLECPAEMLNDWERDMIALYDCISPNGYNLTEGGKGYQRSEETKKKLSDAHKGIHFSEETKKKISNALKGNRNSKGRHLSEESKRKISKSREGKPSNHKGKHHSEETKIKISEARKGRISNRKGEHHSEEAKKKISEALKGKHWKIENGKRIWY